MRAHPLRVRTEQPCELAGVRCEHRRSGAFERLELEERVGVHHRGKVDRLEKTAHERTAPRPAPQPRAEGDRPCSLRGCGDRLDRILVAPADLDRLQNQSLRDGDGLGRDRERHIARVSAKGRERGEAGRARHARLPTDDEHGAGRVLRVSCRAARNALEEGHGATAVLRRSPVEADVRDHYPPCVEATRSDDEPQLGPVERHGEVRVDGSTCDLSGGGVDSGRKIDGDDSCVGSVDAVDQRCGFRARLAPEPGSEERVDDDVVPLDLGCLVGLVPRLAEDARSDAAVATVRAAAAHAGEASRGRKGQHGFARDRHAGPLHQLRSRFGIPRIPLLGGAHLFGRVERLVHLLVRKTGTG